MALNLSTLTSPATSGDVLAEALTTADFLEGVPVLRNLARGSQKGGDAKQDVALNQPKALPLDANGKGYCYLPVTTGNAPAVTFPTIGASDDFVLEMVAYIVDADHFNLVTGANLSNRFLINYIGNHFYDGYTQTSLTQLSSGLSTLTVERSSGLFQFKQNGVVKASYSNHTRSYNFSHLSFNGQFSTGVPPLNGYIQTCTLSIEGTEQLNIDFTATNVRHGDTKIKCATGQVVTINKSGNDPATIIKKPVLRFANQSDDTTAISLKGLLDQTITDGYMFAAFSVLGNGGEQYGRILGLNSTGSFDSSAGGVAFRRNGTTTGLMLRYNAANITTHSDLFDDERGDYLLDIKVSNGSQQSKVNNADADNGVGSIAGSLSAEEFSIASYTDGDANRAAIDLEYLALFPATITDAQAEDVRNYINNRNNVFDLKDGFGYYFFDAQKAPAVPITSGSSSWNGRIVGSDFGDTNRYLTQGTSNDAPVGNGYTVTFADNSDHLDIPQVTQAGWQVVGTSLGTFAYRVDNDAVTELNLLGNLGNTLQRRTGDLYGIILLPESATGRDIEQARKLLIDRGAADSVTTLAFSNYWRDRRDIIEFKHVDTASCESFFRAWYNCVNQINFPLLDATNVTNMQQGWINNHALQSFPAIQAPLCTSFSGAWQSCSALTSFPAGAKLGTAAENVNFNAAWKASGLTSFPALDLSTGTNFTDAWNAASSLNSFGAIDARKGTSFSWAWYTANALTSFPSDALLGTEANNVNFDSAWRSSGLTSFSTPLPTAGNVSAAWLGAVYLSSFNTALPLAFNCNSAWAYCSVLVNFNLTSIPEGIYFSQAFRNSGLVDFNTNLPKANTLSLAFKNCQTLKNFSVDVFANWNPASIPSGIFNDAWDGCTSLTAQSVENILTSIDASGKYATSTGASGGSALADAGIDIDYDGTTLSAATNAAVTSLKSKGWVIVVNNVTL